MEDLELTPISEIESSYNETAESLNRDLQQLHEFSNRKLPWTTTFVKKLKHDIHSKHQSLLEKRPILDNYYSKQNGNDKNS